MDGATESMAGSPNAFANSKDGSARPTSVLSEQDHNVRSHKRARLSEDAVAEIHMRCVDAETSLEVDHMMLDYLAYQTIKACFASRGLSDQDASHLSLSNNVSMSNAFLAIFKARHPAYRPDAELRFRIVLLQLVTLFTQRLTANPTTPTYDALAELRHANRQRADHWIKASNRPPTSTCDIAPGYHISRTDLERNRANALPELDIPAEDEQYADAHYGTRECVSLLDLIPTFMQVSAARNALCGSNLTERWKRLACEFMLQACLEQALMYGTMDNVDEAFAWGYLEDAVDVHATSDNSMPGNAESRLDINTMFEDEDYMTEVDGWNELKSEYLEELRAPQSSDESNGEVLSHLESVSARHPIIAFEASLLQFLQAISNSTSLPVLAQLEKGRLEGMTEQETQAFLDECGFGVGKFFTAPCGF